MTLWVMTEMGEMSLRREGSYDFVDCGFVRRFTVLLQ